MLSIRAILAVVVATAFYASGANASTQHFTKKELHARQLEAAKRWRSIPPLVHETSTSAIKNITFSNPKASEFFVDGTTIPDVEFDVGPSWAGLLPISGDPDETRQLFFWFFPPGPQGSVDDLIFWSNGGPGCSSLEGFLQENGPISWMSGQAKPTANEFSWTNLSSVLWVDQPVGTGFSQGKPTARDGNDVAAQLVGFFQQFLEVFSELKGNKFYLTGESYAGMFLPYIANYIYEHPGALDLDLQGVWMSDPTLSWYVVQRAIPALNFVKKYENIFSFNQSFIAELEKISADCHYTDYMDKFLTYPPKGLLPIPGNFTFPDEDCDTWELILNASLIVNPAFSVYHIFDTFPILWSVMGSPVSPEAQQTPLYFNRTEVQKAIHAPLGGNWELCSDINNVFPHGDETIPPVFTVLPNVIEKNNRNVIVHGLADFILIAEGTRITIQNMTWDGQQGFQTPITADSFIVDGIGALGTTHTERGLTYYEVKLSGHMVPGYSPVASFQIMQYLMGFRATP